MNSPTESESELHPKDTELHLKDALAPLLDRAIAKENNNRTFLP